MQISNPTSSLFLSILLMPAIGAADTLENTFLTPPHDARPHTWYHMMNGNVTKAGITRDFEAIADLGLGGVQMFDAGCAIPAGDLSFNSPEWFDMLHHAAKEARRLGLEICLPNCSGWSSSGGPWNPPSNGMKRVVFKEVSVCGPKHFRASIPRETNDHGFYQDIAVLSFPTPPAEHESFPEVSTVITDRTFTSSSKRPFTSHGIAFRLDYRPVWLADVPVKISISNDGVSFDELETFSERLAQHGIADKTLRQHAFPRAVTARMIKVEFGKAKVDVQVKEARPIATRSLSDIKSKTFEFRNEFEVPRDTLPATQRQIVKKSSILDITDRMTCDGTLDWDVPPGDWTILRFGFICNGRKNHPASKHGVGLEVDKLSSSATDFHFEQYIAEICRHLGPLAGNVESGFNNLLVDSYEVGSQNWTDGFERIFQERYGYSIVPYLPIFAGRIVNSVDESERALEDFRRVVADLFAANYAGALSAKCRKYGLKLSLEPYGNCPSDNLQYGEFADIPMGEFWSGANHGNFHMEEGNARMPANVAHVWGRKIAATESFTTASIPYGSGRWLTTPFSLKAQCDRIYTRGVNRIIYHRFAHQPWADREYLPGMTMGLYGMHFDRTQTWWPFAHEWIRYQSRCQAMLQAGEYVADVLFYCGGDAPNQGGNPGGHHQFGDNPDLMMPPGWSWDICPKSAFMRLAVKDGRVVAPSGLSYPLLALPPMETMGIDELSKLEELIDAGARICGRSKPVRARGLAGYPSADKKVTEAADRIWNKGIMPVSPVEALADLGIGIDFAASGMSMDGTSGIAFTHRRSSEADWYFVALPNREPTSFEASFRTAGRIPEIWNPENGTIRTARDWRVKNGRTIVRLSFPVSGSAFVVFRTSNSKFAPPVEEKFTTVSETVINGAWNVHFPNGFKPNAMAQGTDEIVVFDRLIDWRNSLERNIRHFSGTAKYTKTVQVTPPETGMRIILDLGELHEVARVTMNGRRSQSLWKPPYTVDVTQEAASGTLKLEIDVANLWVNRLIGDERTCADDCEWNENGGIKKIPEWVKMGEKSPTGRITFTTWKHWKKTDRLLPSGLIGPVRLITEKTDSERNSK